MTNKEAIEILKGIDPIGVYSPTEELRHEAINMAISALTTTQKEPTCIYNRTPEERKVSCRYCSATCKARVAETASEDLEVASDEYADKHGFRVPYDGSNNFYDKVDVKASKEGFIAGAQWQKKQMMKEAVESEIENTFSLRKLTPYSTNNGDLQYYGRISLEGNYKRGDKVKLIIVKEE